MTNPLFARRTKLPVTLEIRSEVVERITLGDSIREAVQWAKDERGVVIGVSTVLGWPEYNEAKKAKNALRNQAAREAIESSLCENVNSLNKHMAQLREERENLVADLSAKGEQRIKSSSQDYSRLRSAIKQIDASYAEYMTQYTKILGVVRGTSVELSEEKQTAEIKDVMAELERKANIDPDQEIN